MPNPDAARLRQCVLAVSVLGDLDIMPSDAGVHLPDSFGTIVAWRAIEDVIGAHDPSGSIARRRVENLLRLHRVVGDLGQGAPERFRATARVVALPPNHPEHPGPEWVRETLRGNALDLGIGVLGLVGEMDRTTPVPPSVLHQMRVDGRTWWPGLRDHVERMGSLSAARLIRDGESGLVRPVGGCDVLALLGSRTLRRHLAQSDGTGLRALAVPTRRRGWFDVRQIDPAFIRAAWSLTDEHERGLPVPLLVTADEVSLPFSLA